MPNITKTSSFENEPVKIAVAVNESAGVDENAGLDAVITENERRILLMALGRDQYNTLQTELGKLPFNTQSGDNADQVYIDLVNGKDEWPGLAPMLDNYIYCAWLRATEITVTAVGAGKGVPKGYNPSSLASDFSDRWNVFVDAYEDLITYLEDSDTLEVPKMRHWFEYNNSLGL